MLVNMLTTYLDANVYNDVERGNIPAEEVAAFRAVRDRGDLVPRLSVVDLEESLGLWGSDRAAALKRVQIIRDLAGFDNQLKQPGDLLAEAIRAYATRATAPSPLMARPERRHLASILEKMAKGRQILADVKTQKESFRAAMQESLAKTLVELTMKYSAEQLREVPFEHFFAQGAMGWAEDFAEHLGREVGDACRVRGLDGLLAVRTVRVTVGTTMSVVHSQVCGGRQPAFGDGYDLWHAVLASATDVLVTGDNRLYDHVSRVPGVDGFRVVKSFGELLEESRSSRSR